MPDMKFNLEEAITKWRQGLAATARIGGDELDELEDHLHTEIEALRAAAPPLSDEEAFLVASHRFGKERDVRDEFAKMAPALEGDRVPRRGLDLSGWLEARWLDLRLAARLLAKRPAFATLAVLTLALGIGANTAIFSVVRGVLLRPLAFAEPERLVKVWPQSTHSKRRWAEYRETTRALDDVALWSGWGTALTGDGEPEVLIGAATSANLFEVLGVEPALGRAFAAGENQPGKTDVVLLSDRLWRRRFGADPTIVGRKITLDATPNTVIGVMPAGFRYPGGETEYWAPLPIAAELDDYSANYLQMIGRLAPGSTLEQAEDEVRRLVERIHEENPDLAPSYGRDATVVGLREDLVGPFRPPLLLLLGAVAAVLAIASTNLAGLLLGRALERRREISMRAALGASRTRLAEQLLAESMLLAVLGGGLGLCLAFGSHRLLLALFPSEMPRLHEVALDVPVLIFAVTVTLVAGLVCGLLPALQGASPRLGAVLREGALVSRGSSRLRGALVVAEVALALVLVLGAGLLIRSFYLLTHVESGFRAAGVLKMYLMPSDTVYEGEPEKLIGLYDRILEEVAGLPGVKSAGISHIVPLSRSNWSAPITLEDQPDLSGEASPWADFRVSSGGYFETLGIPLLRGRTFAETDGLHAPRVAIINAKMARIYWPDEEVLGKRIRISPWGGDAWYTVIGVVGDAVHLGLDSEPRPEIYTAYSQIPYPTAFFLTVKAPEATALVPAIRDIVRRLDPAVPLSEIEPMEALVARSVEGPRLWAGLLVAFAAVALLLGAMGIYGVMAHWVAQRTREIGIRLALGLGRPEVRWMVLRRALVLTAAGTVLGLVGALALQGLVASLLFEVKATDPWTLTGVAATIFAVAAAACYLPAWRAARIEPVVALRHE